MTEEELKLLKKQWKEQENLKPTIYYSEDYVKELQKRIDKVVNDMEDVLQKYTYYDDYSVDASMINFWVEMLLGSENNE